MQGLRPVQRMAEPDRPIPATGALQPGDLVPPAPLGGVLELEDWGQDGTWTGRHRHHRILLDVRAVQTLKVYCKSVLKIVLTFFLINLFQL